MEEQTIYVVLVEGPDGDHPDSAWTKREDAAAREIEVDGDIWEIPLDKAHERVSDEPGPPLRSV